MCELSTTSVGKLSINVFYDVKTRSSFCWKYFGHLIVTDGKKRKMLNSGHVYCSACLSAVKRDSEDIAFGSVKIKRYNKTVSTGNLTRHLRDEHNIRDDVASEKDRIKKKNFAVVRPAKASSSTGLPKTRHEKWLLAKDLSLWFCKSLLPFDSVSDNGMVDFLKQYNIVKQDDDVPSSYVVSGPALSDVYETMMGMVKEIISIDAAQHFAMSFDLWTDQYRRLNYITFTLHYLSPDFELKAFTLNTEIMTDWTDEKINDVIQNIKKRFILEGKEIIAVTDAVENMKKAVSMANMTNHLCLGHGLHNLITVDGINSVQEIKAVVEKCKKIVMAMRYRAPEVQVEAEKVKQQLQFLCRVDEIIETLERDESDPIPQVDVTLENVKTEYENKFLPSRHNEHISIKTAIPTRWHSVLEMLESVIHISNQKPINNILRKIGLEELRINQSEWNLLKDLVTFLKGFREAVEVLLSQKTCTLNVALIFRSEIIDVLNSVHDDDSEIMLHLKRNMMANINKRFPVTKLIVAAALLDNRFMSLKQIDIFLESHNMTRTSFLSSYIKEVISINEMPDTLAEHSMETSLLHKLSKKHSINACQGIQDGPIEQECWRYINTADPAEPKDGNLLSHWNSKKQGFPYLAALAKAILCVPATSTPSERVFSTAGLTITAKRSRLNPIRLNKIIFIHDNYRLCMTDK